MRFLVGVTVTDIKRLGVELLMKRLVPQGEGEGGGQHHRVSVGEGGAPHEEVSTIE